jgi:hypothetical protein
MVSADKRVRDAVAKALAEADALLDEEEHNLRDTNTILEANYELHNKVVELESQIQKMQTDSCTCSGCDWRENDG